MSAALNVDTDVDADAAVAQDEAFIGIGNYIDKETSLKVLNTVDGTTYSFVETSLFIFHASNPFRKAIIRLVVNPIFENVILLCVLLSCLSFSIADYTYVDSNGKLLTDQSWRNSSIAVLEYIFIAVFSTEFVLKVIAMGFVSTNGAYLNDYWNIIDFVVLLLSLISVAPSVNFGGVNILRTLRVFRALKSLKALPGVRAMVVALMGSASQLVTILILLLTVFIVFAIGGMLLFQGPDLHRRCRLTPYPVNTSWNSFLPPEPYRCLNAENFDDQMDHPSWTKGQSPWATPQANCYWPVDNRDTRFCSSSSFGLHICQNDETAYPDARDRRYCGSNYDALGNFRFVNIPDSEQPESYISDLNWGESNFDSLGLAFTTIFQCITLAGWGELMYHVQDSTGDALGAAYFVSLIIICYYFGMQLLLATISQNYEEAVEDTGLNTKLGSLKDYILHRIYVKGMLSSSSNKSNDDNSSDGHVINYTGEMDDEDYILRFDLVGYCKAIIESKTFDHFTLIVIVLNTAVISMDHYPSTTKFSNSLDLLESIFTMLYLLEMILKIIGMGLIKYLGNSSCQIDGPITLLSFIVLCFQPPVAFGGEDDGKVSPLSSLRCVRLFKLFRLVQIFLKSKRITVLINAIMKTINKIYSFLLILFIIVYIYAVIGMQLFANKFRFDTNGYPIRNIRSPEWFAADEVPRTCFDSFPEAMIAAFQIITMDSWDGVMFTMIRSNGRRISLLYLITLTVFGSYVLMNLFLAILLNNLHVEGLELDNEIIAGRDDLQENVVNDYENSLKKFDSMKSRKSDAVVGININSTTLEKSCFEIEPTFLEKSNNDESTARRHLNEAIKKNAPLFSARREFSSPEISLSLTAPVKLSVIAQVTQELAQAIQGKNDNDEIFNYEEDFEYTEDIKTELAKEDDEVPRATIFPLDEVNTLFCFSPQNKIRIFFANIIDLEYFETLMFTMIIVSSVALVIDSPLLNPASKTAFAIFVIDCIVSHIFLIESVMKLVVYGGFISPRAYFRDLWNVLDLVVVIVSMASLYLANSTFKSFRILRSLKTLRVLRLSRRFTGIRLVCSAIIAVLPDIFWALLISFSFLFVFSIFCVTFFKGQFRTCGSSQFRDFISKNSSWVELMANPPTWDSMSQSERTLFGPQSPVFNFSSSICTENGWPTAPCCPQMSSVQNIFTSRHICECWGAKWIRLINVKIDNVFEGIVTMLKLSTMSGWADAMYAAMDSTSIDMLPVRNFSVGWMIYFFVFVLLSGYISMNIFVGVVIDNFQRMRRLQDGSFFLTETQREYVRTQEIIYRLHPVSVEKRPHNSVLALFHDIGRHQYLELLCAFVQLVNTVVYSMHYFGESDFYTECLVNVDAACSAVFTIELILKIISMKLRYFYDPVNLFDFLLVILLDFTTIYNRLVHEYRWLLISKVLRLLRLQRIFRFFSGNIEILKPVYYLLHVFLVTLPGIVNVLCLILLLLFFYATIGIQLFSETAFHGEYNEHANFRSFYRTMLTLTRFATLDGWTQFMHDAAHHKTGCIVNPNYDPSYCGYSDHPGCIPLNGCGSTAIYPYLTSFVIVIGCVFFNLFISMVIDGCQEGFSADKSVKTEDLFRFQKMWAKFDPDATCLIGKLKLIELIKMLYKPLGFDDVTVPNSFVLNKINRMQLNTIKKRYHFKDILLGLTALAILEEKELQNKDKKAEDAQNQDIELVDMRNQQDNVNMEAEKHINMLFEPEHDSFETILQPPLDLYKKEILLEKKKKPFVAALDGPENSIHSLDGDNASRESGSEYVSRYDDYTGRNSAQWWGKPFGTEAESKEPVATDIKYSTLSSDRLKKLSVLSKGHNDIT